MIKKKTIVFMVIAGVIISSCFRPSRKDDDSFRRGWSLVREDNFDKSSDEYGWSKIQKGKLPMFRYMNDSSALYISQEGNLVLRGIANPAGNASNPFFTGGITGDGIKANETKRIEVRSRLKPVSGVIPYVTLLAPGEKSNIYIDIMERYNSDAYVYQSVTSEYTTTEGMADNPPSSALVRLDPNQYHVYGVEKYPDSIVFFVDGERTKKYPRIPTKVPGQFPYNNVDFNLFIGLRMENDTDITSLPAEMYIDWVRYYDQEQTDVP